MMISKDKEFVYGIMVKNILVNGKPIKCRVKGYLLGLIKNVIKGNLKKINLMGKVNLIGLMELHIMGNGRVEK